VPPARHLSSIGGNAPATIGRLRRRLWTPPWPRAISTAPRSNSCWTPPGPHSVLKRPAIGVKSQTRGVSYASVKQRVCRHFVAGPLPRLLLAMQKVEGSNPFSRFREGLHLQVFFVEAVRDAFTSRLATPRRARPHPAESGSAAVVASIDEFMTLVAAGRGVCLLPGLNRSAPSAASSDPIWPPSKARRDRCCASATGQISLGA
jgi:hypothetical protein